MPSPRRGAGSTLEYLFRDYTGPRRDVRPAGSVIPVTVNPMPSPPLQHYAGHCDDIPKAVGEHGDKTSPRRPLCHIRAPHQWHPRIGPLRQPDDQPLRCHPRSRSCTSTGRTTTPRLGRIRQDGRQLSGTARHASPRRDIVRHACKLLPPWPIKGGAVPQPRGDETTDSDHQYALRLSQDIGTRLNQYHWDLDARSPPHPLVAPSTSTTVRSNIVPRAHHCWTYDPDRNQDKPSVLSC
jgi:hypothetical protein